MPKRIATGELAENIESCRVGKESHTAVTEDELRAARAARSQAKKELPPPKGRQP
jgi:hypothetical protein